MQRLMIVTGASSGIGGGLAAAAAEDGAVLATVSRRPGPGSHLAADLSDPGSWEAVGSWMLDQMLASAPDWVGLAHCAATLTPIGFAGEVDLEEYTRNVLLNSASPQVLGARFLRAATEAGLTGALLQISSGAATAVYPGWSSYCAAKAAVDQWSRVTGREQARAGSRVRVISVAPGVVATDMQKEIRGMPPERFPEVARFQALERDGALADPTEVGRKLWKVMIDEQVESGSVLDLRKV